MKKPKKDFTVDPKVLDQLRAYRALDNPIRIQAFALIQKNPNSSFSELARGLSLQSGLVAYHIGVLKAAGLVDVRYARRGMETSEYSLTERGSEIFQQLLKGRELGLEHRLEAEI